MEQVSRLTLKLSAIICATLLAAAVSASAKEGETRKCETKLGGQVVCGDLVIGITLEQYEPGLNKRAKEIRAEGTEKRIQLQWLVELTERAASAEKDSLRVQIAAVEAEKRAPAESKGVADRPAHLHSNYEVPVQKLAQARLPTPSKPAPLGRTTPGTHPIGPQEEKFFYPDKKTPPPGLPPEELGKSPEKGAAEKAAAEKAAAEKAAAEKAAAEKALKLKAAEEKAAAAAAAKRAPSSELGLGALGVSLVVVVSLWLLRRKKASAPVQELLRKALVNPEEVGRLVGSNATSPQDVDVTVFAPPVVLLSEEVTVQVIFHTPDREGEALTRAQKAEPAARALAWVPLTIQVRQNDIIKVSVECLDATIPDPVDSTVWNGRLVFLYFTVRMPDVETIVKSKLRVFVNDIPAGKIEFKILVTRNCSDLPRAPANERVRAYHKHFLSYASEDRVQVLKYAQFLHAQKMDYFQDLLSLSPGERWERRLFAEIDRCDVFALFWSHHAQQSEWVIREAEYALHCAKAAPEDQAPEITPIILEAPPPLPPVSLKDIHFNDPIRSIIFAEEIITRGMRGVACADESRP